MPRTDASATRSSIAVVEPIRSRTTQSAFSIFSAGGVPPATPLLSKGFALAGQSVIPSAQGAYPLRPPFSARASPLQVRASFLQRRGRTPCDPPSQQGLRPCRSERHSFSAGGVPPATPLLSPAKRAPRVPPRPPPAAP